MYTKSSKVVNLVMYSSGDKTLKRLCSNWKVKERVFFVLWGCKKGVANREGSASPAQVPDQGLHTIDPSKSGQNSFAPK